MNNKRKKSASGFTLIELSIVLVIIGLLIGSVLVGKDLIHSSEIRSQVSQLQNFDMATSTFKQRYGYLPGDINNANANSFGIGTNCCSDSNQNGIIDDFGYPITRANVDAYKFFIHLAKAGLINDITGKLVGASGNYACGTINPDYKRYVGCQFPQAKIGAGGFIATSLANTKLAYFLGATTTEQTATNNNYNIYNISTGATITASDAFALDTKLDDGLPTTGKIESVKYPYDYSDAYGCISGNGYNITNTNLACNLLIESSGQ